jgi:hypothetical protein
LKISLIVKNWLRRKGYRLIHEINFEGKHHETKTLQIEESWLQDVKLVSSREAVLKELGSRNIIAEIGVGFGDFSCNLLRTFKPIKFVAIDLFNVTKDGKWGRALQESGKNHMSYFKQQVAKDLEETELIIKQGVSWEEIAKFQDNFFDYIYIDADHKYESVKKDISIAQAKVKLGGLLQCNDFTHFDSYNFVHYGVPRAVFELINQGNFKLTHLCLHPHGFYDVVLERIS